MAHAVGKNANGTAYGNDHPSQMQRSTGAHLTENSDSEMENAYGILNGRDPVGVLPSNIWQHLRQNRLVIAV